MADGLSETFNQFKARSSCWLAFAEVCMMILRIIVANEQSTRCSPESSEALAGLKDKMGCCRVRLFVTFSVLLDDNHRGELAS